MIIDKYAKRPYQIVDYDPQWPQRFEEIKKVFKKIFGDKALDIIHVGSTAVVGLKAKPVIDVLIIVKNIENFSKEKQDLEKLGYIYEDNYIDKDTILITKQDDSKERLENIHVCPKDSTKTSQFIFVTEYFKKHPEDAMAYTKLKEALFKKYPNDYPAYRAGKQDFLKRIYKTAFEEKNIATPENYSFIK